jgi:hypothetical protein
MKGSYVGDIRVKSPRREVSWPVQHPPKGLPERGVDWIPVPNPDRSTREKDTFERGKK